MRIKIVRCKHDWYWYNDYIGKSFNVITHDENTYQVIDDIREIRKYPISCIMKEDCELLENIVPPKIQAKTTRWDLLERDNCK
jgi:hypothetical protein